MKTKNKLLSYVDKNMPSLLADLQKLINQPSISATNEGIDKCATLVSNMLKKSGIQSEILRLGKNIPPVVYGEVKSKKNPNKTLLFYNHYDVQPVEPLELWKHDPFSGKIIGNKILFPSFASQKVSYDYHTVHNVVFRDIGLIFQF